MLSCEGICKVLLPLLLLSESLAKVQGKPQQTKPGCSYLGRRYLEGLVVPTPEPCLQCRCVEGSLRCRLRVCPRLPQPTPAGCRARPPAENACCPELVCGGEDESENILQRSHEEVSHRRRTEEGCLYEGVRYGPGSAMMGSRRCEYCYCISGARRCIRPKCLLPLPGCAPLYAPYSCCPVAYNCTRQAEFSTTLAAISGNGCRAGQRLYQEGEMVRDIAWKAACDNCFCAMGAIRCVPLACAPPLQGCKPIVREGQCCPSTYNCSGTIEVKAAQNYASYAFISKDYAKFRKETNFYPAIHDAALSVEGRGHRVVNEALDAPEIITEKFAMATESIPTLETETMNNEILGETTDYPRHTTRDQELLTGVTTEISTSTDASSLELSGTTTMRSQAGTEEATSLSYPREASTTLQEDTLTEETTPTATTLSGGGTSPADDEAATVTATAATVVAVAEVPESTRAEYSVNCSSRRKEELESPSGDKVHLETTSSINLGASASATTSTTKAPTPNSTSAAPTTTTTSRTPPPTPTTTTTTTTPAAASQSSLAPEKEAPAEGNNNKAVPAEEREKVDAEKTVIAVKKPSSGLSTSIIVPDDMLVMNVTVKTNVAVGNIHGVTINPIGKPIPPDIQAILNITHRGKGQDYEYDYSEPTLPPSLPNVRIIPFVAADALVKDKDEDEVPSAVTGYPVSAVAVAPELRPTDANFYDIVTQKNRFSPPEKTEGGFVPREPPYFEPLFHSSDLNLEIGTGVTVAPELLPVANPHRKTDELSTNCLYEEREYGHGQILPSSASCVTCLCYYGEIVCTNQKCPPLKIGCRRVSSSADECCSKMICVDGVESPTVVLDRVDSTLSSQHEPTVSPDPFRDVIKTEPAPDLPSLIGDMMIPYLVEHSITTSSSIESADSSYLLSSRNDSLDGLLLEPPPPDRNLVSRRPAAAHKAGNCSESSSNPITEQRENDSIFSLDSVLDLFFNDPKSNETNPRNSTTASLPSSTSTSSTTTTTTTTTATATQRTTTTEKDVPAGLLKLAGCNIYGRMYRVGKIIAELSNPCLECRCTELGVQCKKLDC